MRREGRRGAEALPPPVRLAFVVQRYGIEVGGGAELHCRWLAEHLAQPPPGRGLLDPRPRSTVDWANAYPGGTRRGQRHPRPPLRRGAPPEARGGFASLSNVGLQAAAHPRGGRGLGAGERAGVAGARRRRWRRPATASTSSSSSATATTTATSASRRWRDRAVLVPTAEEDPAIGLARLPATSSALPRGHRLPHARGAGSRREQAERHGPCRASSIGSGLDLPEAAAAPRLPRDSHGLDAPLPPLPGPDRPNKGCATLFAYFQQASSRRPAGRRPGPGGQGGHADPRAPADPPLGFVCEEEKVAALRARRRLVMPSPYESLSLVLLEAWKLGVPVLANARCRVLAGQCQRSGGGLSYDGYAEFARGALRLLLERPELRATLGRQGRDYVERGVLLGAGRRGDGRVPRGARSAGRG